MDTTDPDIWFDAQGVSSHALHYEAELSAIVEAATAGKRQPELDALVAQIKKSGKDKPYDCVIGVSGGVDSTYLIYRAVKLGLRPLAVHFDSGWNSELAVENIENIVTKLGLDLVTDVVDWREMKDLQLAFFKASVANQDIPTDHAFPAIAFREAARYGIKYILSGFNYATESVLPVGWGFNATDSKHLRAIHKKFGTGKLSTYPVMSFWKKQIWYPKVKGIKVVSLLNYMPYIKTDAKTTITKELDWRDYGGKHYESVFTRYFQGHYLPTKFGYDKRKAHLSSLILSGQITREQALEELKEPPYDHDLLAQDHEFIAKKLGLSVAEFDAIIAHKPVSHYEYPNQEKLYKLFNTFVQKRSARKSAKL